jgi:hypothetical protein
MRAGKPTVPENITGILTSSDYNFAHTSSVTKIMYKNVLWLFFEDLGHLLPINYVCIAAFAPGLQRATFYSVTEFLPYSITMKLLPLHNTYKRSYRALEPRYDAEKLLSALCLLSRTNSCKAATLVSTSD